MDKLIKLKDDFNIRIVEGLVMLSYKANRKYYLDITTNTGKTTGLPISRRAFILTGDNKHDEEIIKATDTTVQNVLYGCIVEPKNKAFIRMLDNIMGKREKLTRIKRYKIEIVADINELLELYEIVKDNAKEIKDTHLKQIEIFEYTDNEGNRKHMYIIYKKIIERPNKYSYNLN